MPAHANSCLLVALAPKDVDDSPCSSPHPLPCHTFLPTAFRETHPGTPCAAGCWWMAQRSRSPLFGALSGTTRGPGQELGLGSSWTDPGGPVPSPAAAKIQRWVGGWVVGAAPCPFGIHSCLPCHAATALVAADVTMRCWLPFGFHISKSCLAPCPPPPPALLQVLHGAVQRRPGPGAGGAAGPALPVGRGAGGRRGRGLYPCRVARRRRWRRRAWRSVERAAGLRPVLPGEAHSNRAPLKPR